MHNNENDRPKEVTREDLLRFLDAGPKILHWPASHGLSSESFESHASGPDCPEAHSFVQLVVGSIGGEEAEKLLDHAADCDACGDVLARGLSALEGNPSPEEVAAIAQLASARSEWQRQTARQMAASPARKRPGFWFSTGWMAGGAVAATVLLAAGLFAWNWRANTPEHQLAMAYEQSRALELRIPDAGYAAQSAGRHTRGAAGYNEPAPLLDARARLARELERSPQDTHWLQLQARADVLAERYDPAVDVLDRLIAQGPVTPELLADAASAYYQRGLVSGSELDRSTALDYLRRADELAPTDPVILFNEAIVMEDRGQMMNAVEVWNRYLTVERDQKWAAEGRRKLAMLEQTLNKLKSHQSRVDQMLATPQAIDKLAADTGKLAQLDEELSTYDLDKLLLTAYPADRELPQGLQPVRGSPCTASCLSARKLLKAIGSSLEIQHHDSWLSDLISPDIDTLSSSRSETYVQAIRQLAFAVRNDLTGSRGEGARLAAEARQLFLKLEDADPTLQTAARVGDERAELEYMYALQRQQDFRGCREAAARFNARPAREVEIDRYPWIKAVEMLTEKVCDDTPETRRAGQVLEMAALRMAEADHYLLLIARTKIRLVDDAQDAGDDETAEQLTLATLRDLYAADSPSYRIANTVNQLTYMEEASSRRYMTELCEKEALAWLVLDGDYATAGVVRIDLARAEMRIGAMKESHHQLDLALNQGKESGLGETLSSFYREPEIALSKSLLEQGDLNGADHYLQRVANNMNNYSDSWGLRAYAAAQGQLDLARGKLDQAVLALESEIRSSEGRNVLSSDPVTVAEYAQQDHDLYAELAAAWLAQGRPPESVLALWERFRLRSRGLPITQCRGEALDCDQPKLHAALGRLGGDVLSGQILLLDRVLIYHADNTGVAWDQKPLRRQDVIDAAQMLERAVSSPYTSPETAARLGASLTDMLLLRIPAELGPDSILLLEPDPMLQNLSWPVLPTPAGPLGLRYALAESRSILAFEERSGSNPVSGETMCKRPLVVGASVASGNEPPLPEVIEEAFSIGQQLHANEILLGKQATTANLAQMLGTATIFHFAGHALQTVDGTELRLAETSPGEAAPWVDGAFLRRHPPLHCQLAVLSACSTGMHEAAWKRPLQDIVETLGALGVPQVVATRWQIDSQAAVPFMNAFYQELATGKSVAMALSLARRVQFGESVYRNPYYWGAYYVTGRDNSHLKKELHARL